MTELDTVENRAEADTTARETKCRQLAGNGGLVIKSRTRNPDLIDFGLYGLIDLLPAARSIQCLGTDTPAR